jgi:hypothetical protein
LLWTLPLGCLPCRVPILLDAIGPPRAVRAAGCPSDADRRSCTALQGDSTLPSRRIPVFIVFAALPPGLLVALTLDWREERELRRVERRPRLSRAQSRPEPACPTQA